MLSSLISRARRPLGLLATTGVLLGLVAAPSAWAQAEPPFTTTFGLDDCAFKSRGQTTYFVLQPNHQLVLVGPDGETTITVLNQTRRVGGVETRVVEERHTEDGELKEISRNYFAICQQTSSVFYFGEEVDNYEDGVVINHDGAWLHGVDGARAGLMMPGMALLGARYHQEIAPGAAMDRAEIISSAEVVQTPAGRFTRVLKTRETTPLEPGAVDFKFYAPGIGLIQDNEEKLARYRLGWGVEPEDDDDEEDD